MFVKRGVEQMMNLFKFWLHHNRSPFWLTQNNYWNSQKVKATGDHIKQNIGHNKQIDYNALLLCGFVPNHFSHNNQLIMLTILTLNNYICIFINIAISYSFAVYVVTEGVPSKKLLIVIGFTSSVVHFYPPQH